MRMNAHVKLMALFCIGVICGGVFGFLKTGSRGDSCSVGKVGEKFRNSGIDSMGVSLDSVSAVPIMVECNGALFTNLSCMSLRRKRPSVFGVMRLLHSRFLPHGVSETKVPNEPIVFPSSDLCRRQVYPDRPLGGILF